MHNLDLTFFKEYDLLDVPSPIEFKIDPVNDDKIYFRDKDTIYLVSLNTKNVTKITDFPCEIIGFEYLSMNHELCVALEDGGVVIHNLTSGTQEEVTYCDDGVSRMEWSWDQESLVFVTKKLNVVVLNCAYDVVHESNLLEENFGEKKFINVGWGTEETQFQGLGGKKLATNKGDELLESQETSEDENSVLISWREDCEYFSVLFFHPNTRTRMFKVFNKEGVLQFTSEKCSALQNSIAWRPSGNWIAVPEIYRNKYTISLFEKNGLKHREIVLPFKFEEEFVVKLMWSPDSEILVIQTEEQERHCLYLYTIGNYHWYLKQTLRFDTKIDYFTWSPRSNEKKTLFVAISPHKLLSYQWNYVINASQGEFESDQGVIGVIDGKKLLLTGLRGTVIPPPMSNFVLEHEKEINFVRFITKTHENTNQFVIIDATNDIYTYKCVFLPSPVPILINVEKLGSFSFKIPERIPLKLHHWLYKSPSDLVFTDGNVIFYGKIDEKSEINVTDAYELTKKHLGALVFANKTLYAHYSTGDITSISESERNVLTVGQFSSQFYVISDEKFVLLQQKQNLYLNDWLVAPNITSFAVSNGFLMYTTLEELKFVNLRDSKRVVVSERKLERGSKLVHVVAETSKTVLQLPRGNLETIHPRILSLCMIKTLLDAKKYRSAFEIMRKERINLNLLVDHDPNLFLSNLDTVIDDIDNVSWLDIFLTELQNIDVVSQMYPYYDNGSKNLLWEQVTPSMKVDFVCQKMIETLNRRNDAKFCLPLITCHVKRSEVAHALSLIWNLKSREEQGVVGTVTSDDAFKYLLYLVNVNDLYNIALGLYDFGLVLYVAKRSQKDPKEYVPFLEELDKLEDNYRKYKIDCYIKRYGKALENISKCGELRLDEAITLIEKHQLYTIALEAYKSQNECYKKVCKLYGDFLRQKHKLLEASFMYERSEDITSAIACARNALAWKRCISLGKRNKMSEEELKKLYLSLIPALESAGLYSDAAVIAKDHLSRSQAVDILIKGALYEDAVLLCNEFEEELQVLVDEKVKPCLSDYLDSLVAKVDEDLELFQKQKDRLRLLREIKANREENDEGRYMDDDADLFSDTSSMNSSRYTASSGKTSKSSKNRRKHERKLFSLKEGSKFEDIALIDSLHRLVTKVHSSEQIKHVKRILTTATDLNLDQKAKILQQKYKNLMQIMKKSLDEIWIPEMIVSEEVTPEVTGFINYDQIQRNQHYALIKPHQRYKPELPEVDFELEIYK